MVIANLTKRYGTISYFGADVGFLGNLDDTHALGALFAIWGEGEGKGAMFSLKGRYRHWLSRGDAFYGGIGLDVTGGFFKGSRFEGGVFDPDARGDVQLAGGIIEVAIGVGDIIAISAGAHNWQRIGESKQRLEANIGITIGLGWWFDFSARYLGWLEPLGVLRDLRGR